jgi:Phage tail lysozyme
VRLKKIISMRQALESPAYFGTLLAGDSWAAWRVLLIAIVGEALTDLERAIFQGLTGRERKPLEPVEEFWAAIGRRSGKTRAMAALAAYLAACCDHRDSLAPGERGVVPLLAASTQQAANAFAFIEGVFAVAPNLKDLVDGATSDTLSLATGIDISVRPASFRTIRGITAVAAICDEIAFWRSDDSANPDKEILKALRPSLATTGGPLIAISSPHAKRGELYGIGQWLDRKPALMRYLAENKLDPKDFDSQISFAVHELNGSEKRAADVRRNASTPGQAAAGASMYGVTRNFTASTPVDKVLKAIATAVAQPSTL